MARKTQYIVYKCENDDCIARFAEKFKFNIVETVTDGDCFFDAILKSGVILKNGAILKSGAISASPIQYLRKTLVNYMQTQTFTNKYGEFFSDETTAGIQQLRQAGQYATNAGDLPSQFSHDAFGIHLNLFILNNAYHNITLEQHVNKLHNVPTVNIIRIGAHYKLLMPQKGMSDIYKLIKENVSMLQQNSNGIYNTTINNTRNKSNGMRNKTVNKTRNKSNGTRTKPISIVQIATKAKTDNKANPVTNPHMTMTITFL